ncbi:MAG: ankyrin repeat domain-containing protein [Planctomyces sp.]|nr:ankyrin repeat domain-containing protein [Planctomyces sp.]
MTVEGLGRRGFVTWASVLAAGGGSSIVRAQEAPAKPQDPPAGGAPAAPAGPVEAAFERDYDAPKFRPSWKKEQISRLMLQDFVIFAHSELEMVKKLLEREPGLLNGSVDWGGGDFETALGGASHMGRRDIVTFLLERGARIDLFCAAMLGQLEVVKSFLTLQPALIDAKGPHGFSLHFHAQVGGDEAQPVLDYLQSVKTVELKPVPFLKKK